MIFCNALNIAGKEITRICGIGIMAVLLVQSSQDHVFAMQSDEISRELRSFAEEATRVAHDIQEEAARVARLRHERKIELVTQINEVKESGASDSDPRILEALRELERMDKEEALEANVAGVGLGLFENIGNTVIEDYNKEYEIEKTQREAPVKSKGLDS
jgi:hypothetical protein